jgi:hypothetical protein
MSANAAGEFWCDKCGEEVGNGSIFRCAVITDLDPDDPNTIRNLHICRDVIEDDEVVRKGCIKKVLSVANLAHYHEKRSTDVQQQLEEAPDKRGRAKKSAASDPDA